MDINDKLAEAKTLDSEVQLVATVLTPMLSTNPALAAGFTRDEFTWDEMKKFLYEKAGSAYKEKSLQGVPLMVNGTTIMAWVTEFFTLEELPKKPEPVKYTPPTTVASGKKKGKPVVSRQPVSVKVGESDEEEDEDDEDATVPALPTIRNQEDSDEKTATAALKKQISLFEMA